MSSMAKSPKLEHHGLQAAIRVAKFYYRTNHSVTSSKSTLQNSVETLPAYTVPSNYVHEQTIDRLVLTYKTAYYKNHGTSIMSSYDYVVSD